MTDEVIPWIALAHVPGVGPATFRALCERFGGPEQVFAAAADELDRAPGLRAETAAALRAPRPLLDAARRLVGELEADRVRIVTSADPAYPGAFHELRHPPPVLYVLGRLPRADEPAFAVAGSTSASARGRRIARSAGGELADAGWTVVSGYARGIDEAAHLGALEAGGRTVLALPTGVRAFRLRAAFDPFAGELGARITVVSECPPDDGWSARAAVLRDRLIAALGRALLVVEARPDSGTMITFRHAVRMGRPAYVVRYRRAPTGATGNRLAIRSGGLPVPSMKALRMIARSRPLPRAMPRSAQGELF